MAKKGKKDQKKRKDSNKGGIIDTRTVYSSEVDLNEFEKMWKEGHQKPPRGGVRLPHCHNCGRRIRPYRIRAA